MDDAQRSQKHERWLEEGRRDLQRQLQNLMQQLQQQGRNFWISRQLLTLLTLEPPLLELLRQTLQALSDGAIQALFVSMVVRSTDRFCRNPPADEALVAAATELAHIMNSIHSLKSLRLESVTSSIASSLFATCSRLESVTLESCPLVTANIRAVLSIKPLRKLRIESTNFSDFASINEFCLGLEASSLEFLSMSLMSFSREHEEQVATTLARCKTLVHFHYTLGASKSFYDHYCAALSNYFDTKLETLRLYHGALLSEERDGLDLEGEDGYAGGVDEAVAAKLRNMLKLNVQRTTCPPLFAAISNAETDAERKQCLVEAFDTVDIPVVFEYITANKNNLISLIQRLGRSRKRQREE